MNIKNKHRIVQIISQIDLLINRQINDIIHHSDFQALESAWRALFFLLDSAKSQEQVIIKVLNLSYKELQKDLQQAIEFDQSQLFKKIHDQEYDHAGGQPYGLLVGNYEFTPATKDIYVLQELMKISATAFAPLIAGVAPAMFGINHFTELNSSLNFENLYKLPQYQRWMQLCKQENARYIGLVLPHFLMRLPYNQHGKKIKNRFFQETIENKQQYLWSNAAFVYAKIICRTFLQSGWLANIRGISDERNTSGAISELPRNYFSVNKSKDIAKIATDIYLTDKQEKALSDLGFIALKDNPATLTGIFYSSSSIQQRLHYLKEIANRNAHLASMLHYILCVSRFAHYIKIMIRNTIGKFITAEQCEQHLQQWILKYCAASQTISNEAKAKYPLSEAKINIKQDLIEPGKYDCLIQLKPQYQIDEIESQLHLVTKFNLI